MASWCDGIIVRHRDHSSGGQVLVTMTANVTVIMQTLTLQYLHNPLLFRVKESVKKRSPPSCGLRPECSDLHQTFLALPQTSETLRSVPRQARAKKKNVP